MAERKINTALASYGMSGSVFHAPMLHVHPGYQLCKVLERTRMLSKERFPYIEVVKKYDDILNDPAIELVIVNTPDHLHYSMAKEALLAGKHVVVEKPFTQTIEQGKELIGLARERKQLLTVFHNRRFDGDSMTVQKILRDQILGRLVEYEAYYDRYRNFISPGWKEDPATGANILYNLGSHLIDHTLYLFGKPESVWGNLRILRDGARTEDYFEVKLFYEKLIATLKASYLAKESRPRYILHGTLGSFVKSGPDPQEEALKKGEFPGGPGWGTDKQENWGILHTEVDGNSYRQSLETIPGNYMAFYDNLYEAITQKKDSIIKAEEGLEVIKVIEAAFRSHKEKRVIEYTH